MRNFISISILLLILSSCNSNRKDIERAKQISSNWINEKAITLYDQSDTPVLLSTKEDIETQTNFKYIANKYKWKGALEDNEYKFSENSKRALVIHNIYTNYLENISLNNSIENKNTEYKNYLYKWTQRAAKLLESSDCELDIKKTNNIYVIRYFIRHTDNNPEKPSNKYIYDMIDVVLDDNFNVINHL
jgi:hypothetical protein|nr:MAG TPA: Prokaryotic membrane lipoprotein lipid attachment site [Caudoviricetes sp.]